MHDSLIKRVRAEFLEMPGLSVTRQQARRLWGVERAVCERVLDLLVEMKFLSVRPNGVYVRLGDGADHSRFRSASGDVGVEAHPAKAS